MTTFPFGSLSAIHMVSLYSKLVVEMRAVNFGFKYISICPLKEPFSKFSYSNLFCTLLMFKCATKWVVFSFFNNRAFLGIKRDTLPYNSSSISLPSIHGPSIDEPDNSVLICVFNSILTKDSHSRMDDYTMSMSERSRENPGNILDGCLCKTDTCSVRPCITTRAQKGVRCH